MNLDLVLCPYFFYAPVCYKTFMVKLLGSKKNKIKMMAFQVSI